MNSGRGHFEGFKNDTELNERIQELTQLKEKVGSTFHVGEIVEIKDSKFRIRSIGKREMRLRLMKAESFKPSRIGS